MGIRENGYVKLGEHECIYVQDDMNYIVIPKDYNANLVKFHFDKNYIIEISDGNKKTGEAFVEKAYSGNNNDLLLQLKYIVKYFDNVPIDEMVLVGDEIDQFFSTLDYYYARNLNGTYVSSDLLYNQDFVQRYKVKYREEIIQVELVYGNVLIDGIRTDTQIHPHLIIRFHGTRDFEKLYSLAQGFIRFLQFVNGKKKYNMKAFELFGKKNEKQQRIGYLFSSLYNREYRPHLICEASFIWYGSKIEKLLSLIMNEDKFPLDFLNQECHDWFGYETKRFSALCSAFEYEYELRKELYEQGKPSFDEIKCQLLSSIESVETRDEKEKAFKESIIEDIKRKGYQTGLRKKIVNVYNMNSRVFENSMTQLAVRNKDVDKITLLITRLRGKVLHSEMGYIFSDEELEAVRFLEVLHFVMVLKRASFTDEKTELIIGKRYNVNFKWFDISRADLIEKL